MNPVIASRNQIQHEREYQGDHCGVGPVDGMDQELVAELPSTIIAQLNGDELLRVVQSGHLPFLSVGADQHLEFYDHETLVRLANLARRCCSNRIKYAQSGDLSFSSGE